uniref:Uncharacterized protein n=1 Tax=Meloidogyne incognita TaxID=6306 RepID=A0A914NQQ3_MELIC
MFWMLIGKLPKMRSKIQRVDSFRMSKKLGSQCPYKAMYILQHGQLVAWREEGGFLLRMLSRINNTNVRALMFFDPFFFLHICNQ